MTIGRPRSRAFSKFGVLAAAATLYAGMTTFPTDVLAQTADVRVTMTANGKPARQQRAPNIVLILADDLGVEGVNSYGGEYFTPNIDRLAREGMRFDNAHAMPLCSPSRVRLMTGKDNWRNYQAFGYLAPGERTFAHVLKVAGYTTGMVGKWQLMGNGYDGRVGITPEAAGFDDYSLWQLKALDSKGSRYWGPTRVSPQRTQIQEDGFGPDSDLAYAKSFIERNKDRPFFLYYSMVLVHSPFVPTPDSMTAIGAKGRFAGMMSYMDKQVGTLMDTLRKQGLENDTIVIFTADNGTDRQITSMRNGHEVRGGKGMPTISGTHVPFIAWAPNRIAPGSSSQALIGLEDLLPTFAEAAGKPEQDASLDGVSQLPVMLGQKSAVRDWIFQHYAPAWQFAPSRFIFDARYKLYGDGRFVAMDPNTGVETPLAGTRLTAVAARRKAQFERLLGSIKDGPLDETRAPMCAGKPSLDPTKPATVAGCPMPPGSRGGD